MENRVCKSTVSSDRNGLSGSRYICSVFGVCCFIRSDFVRKCRIDTSYRLTAINKLNPVKIRRRFTSAGTEQYGTQIIYIGYLLENDFRSPALFQQMQQNYPLTDDHMLSREYLKEVSSLSFDEDFPLFSSDLAYFTGLKSLRCTDLPQITELDLSRNPELTELISIDGACMLRKEQVILQSSAACGLNADQRIIAAVKAGK